MQSKLLLKLLVCAILCAAAANGVRAQTNTATTNAAAPSFPGRGGGGRGIGRGQFLPPGPPAPVPPEVAIPPPTAEEVAKMNSDLIQFIQTSPDKELLTRYESLLTVQIPRDNPCIRPTGGNLSARHQGFMNIATSENFDVLFLGDSIIRFQRYLAISGLFARSDMNTDYSRRVEFGRLNTWLRLKPVFSIENVFRKARIIR